ncbi:GNAT family N-acetyltransferase [Streptomyces sp. NPDC058417]|uniref:GNAT family N-acetyltransferase n=1 Tax=unclassified Streptomyces TaxID=2593676 RepID=UPI00366A5022
MPTNRPSPEHTLCTIALAPPGVAAEADTVALITRLVNETYSTGEAGMWREGALRTSPEEVRALVADGELVLAHHGDDLVGAVRVQRLPTGEAEFGMLVCRAEQQGLGVGRQLVAWVEDWARGQGIGIMQLEVLRPRHVRHPVKEFLLSWYARIDYHVVRKGAFEEAYPDLEPLLAVDCDFLIHHKRL